MQHRFRTFLPPASGPARAPTAVWGSEVHNETGTGASEQLPEGGRISPDGLAVHEHVCTAGNPAGGAVGKGSFLQCSMSGLVPADAEHSFESLRCLLTKSCSRMSPCCFVDRRSMMVRCRRTCLPSQACPHAAPLVTPAATGTPGSVNYGVVVRTYVYPEGLSGACLVNVVARPESDTAGDWQSTLTGPEIDRPGTGRGHAPVHSVDPPKFEKVDRKSTDASAPAGVNQSVGVSQHRASKRQDVDMVLCYEAVTTGATGDFFHLLDLTEHQVECWKGHVYEFRGGEESDLPHSVFLCRVYTVGYNCVFHLVSVLLGGCHRQSQPCVCAPNNTNSNFRK
ncbi:conserved hypothetical protein [Neospora caninum Liverpool]|uniref:Uncharacterized protein n=1 Tax=Neospora caninum (strain Liverpool) TaxID=572307 RepID=F0VCD8_NEOCL|nr:conserved hypothetical protein [Neospora caninum Liverpool]CBZ50762.1 conserved hypothetical protein [Neospora caninum Liverpool]|eukprot:XP_003880795.1 conserved hypothetical protein [Neospora caninum Liverpool]